MRYAETHVGQRVVVVRERHYPDRFVGQEGEITRRWDGTDAEHGTVEVRLDGESYAPMPPGWMDFTHMGCEQLEAIDG